MQSPRDNPRPPQHCNSPVIEIEKLDEEPGEARNLRGAASGATSGAANSAGNGEPRGPATGAVIYASGSFMVGKIISRFASSEVPIVNRRRPSHCTESLYSWLHTVRTTCRTGNNRGPPRRELLRKDDREPTEQRKCMCPVQHYVQEALQSPRQAQMVRVHQPNHRFSLRNAERIERILK